MYTQDEAFTVTPVISRPYHLWVHFIYSSNIVESSHVWKSYWYYWYSEHLSNVFKVRFSVIRFRSAVKIRDRHRRQHTGLELVNIPCSKPKFFLAFWLKFYIMLMSQKDAWSNSGRCSFIRCETNTLFSHEISRRKTNVPCLFSLILENYNLVFRSFISLRLFWKIRCKIRSYKH